MNAMQEGKHEKSNGTTKQTNKERGGPQIGE